ncbi:MAG: ABC transporter permease [Actinobacteria bacterium]|nr:ABC transporter permease [Actinomycetota bacterium]
MRVFGAAVRLQLRIVRSDPDHLMPLVTVPLFSVTFLAIVRHAGRDDLTGYALLAPVLIALWQLSLLDSGEVIAEDRWQGVLEAVLAAPANIAVVVVGRVFAVTGVSLLAFVEVWLVARVLFGVAIEIHHPLVFALTLAASVVAMSGTALIMAGLFVLARSARTFQNSLSYPFYVLGGVLVPVSFLPDWLEPVSSAVFLSWSADLLRDSLQPDAVSDVLARVTMILALGAAGAAAGGLLLRFILRRVRRTGSLAYA